MFTKKETNNTIKSITAVKPSNKKIQLILDNFQLTQKILKSRRGDVMLLLNFEKNPKIPAPIVDNKMEYKDKVETPLSLK
jgi:hypothetical protein